MSKITAVWAVLDYLAGFFIFGILWVIFDSVLPDIFNYAPQGTVYTLAVFLWRASVVVYLIFGPFYLFGKLKEREVFK